MRALEALPRCLRGVPPSEDCDRREERAGGGTVRNLPENQLPTILMAGYEKETRRFLTTIPDFTAG